MATPVEFSEQNDVLGPKPGTESWVAPLPIYRQGLSFDNGVRHDQLVVSCWEPTPEELAEIARTGRIWLIAHCPTHPPISVCGTNPFVPQPTEQK